jgi:hypothetical protein
MVIRGKQRDIEKDGSGLFISKTDYEEPKLRILI